MINGSSGINNSESIVAAKRAATVTMNATIVAEVQRRLMKSANARWKPPHLTFMG